MRIGVDVRPLRNKNLTGIGFYVYYILCYMAEHDHENEYILYSNREIQHQIPNTGNFKLKIIEGNWFSQKIGSFWLRYYMPKIIKNDQLDVFWGTEHMLPKKVNGIKYVLTIHDLALLIDSTWGVGYNSVIQKKIVPNCIREADKIIADSESTKKDLIRICHVNSDKVQRIYLGGIKSNNEQQTCKEVFELNSKYGVEKLDFLLYFGTIEPRKNIENIIKAFELLAEEYREIYLILAGGLGWKYKSVLKAIKISKYKDQIKLLGYVADDEKRNLFSLAKAFVFPSHYEGFGIPVLEAMEMGTVVITSNKSSLPEIAGNSAIYVEDENNILELKSMMKKAITLDKKARNQYIASGYRQVNKFSWEKCAKETMQEILNV